MPIPEQDSLSRSGSAIVTAAATLRKNSDRLQRVVSLVDARVGVKASDATWRMKSIKERRALGTPAGAGAAVYGRADQGAEASLRKADQCTPDILNRSMAHVVCHGKDKKGWHLDDYLTARGKALRAAFAGWKEGVEDPENLVLRPAVEGTLNVLRSCALGAAAARGFAEQLKLEKPGDVGFTLARFIAEIYARV
eukprot:Skav235376  [mRNA]  locus=scaffold6992:60157:64932:- [translate_table: standard]